MSGDRYLDITSTENSLASREIKNMEEKARCSVDVGRMGSGAHSDSSPGYYHTWLYNTSHLETIGL